MAWSCTKIAETVCKLASVNSLNGLSPSGGCKAGFDMRACFRVLKAVSCSMGATPRPKSPEGRRCYGMGS